MNRVTNLGTEYSIVTPYTSFLVLENDQQFQRFGIKQINKEQIQRDRAAQQRRTDTRTARAPRPSGRRSRGGGGGGSVGLGVLGLLAALAAGRAVRKKS